MVRATELRCGIVGPGRTRNGLGPFLARFADRAGLRVVAGAGRDDARTRRATAALAEELGHPVVPYSDIDQMLSAANLDAIIVATPVVAHRAALQAALAAGVHVLCEKPLVDLADADAVDALCDGFIARELVLVENCQWPYALEAFDRLWPGRAANRPQRIAMGLSPIGPGRPMVEDSLSHLLSVVQALVPLDEGTRVEDIRYSTRSDAAEAYDLEFRLSGTFGTVAALLALERCETQPRPAWIAIDGLRMDREIRLADYAISMTAEDRQVPIDDPLGLLVYSFADRIREPALDRIRRDADTIRTRQRLYRSLIAAW